MGYNQAMAWEPSVRHHKRRGRRPWYTLTVNRHTHYLGTDRSTAYRRAGELLEGRPASSRSPASVKGLIVTYIKTTGAPKWSLRHFADWAGSKYLADLRSDDLQDYADWLKDNTKLSRWTIRHYINYARTLWHWAIDKGWLDVAPGKVKTLVPIRRPRDMKPAILKAAFEKLNPRARVLAEFIVSTGCRPGEARLLKWEQVDIENGVCVLEDHKTDRTGRPRIIYLTPIALEICKKQEHINRWVFNSIRRKPYTKDGLHSVLHRVGINSSYSLRHTFAQWFLDNVGDRSELQEWLGHSDSRMIDVYASIRSDRLRKRAKKIKGPMAS